MIGVRAGLPTAIEEWTIGHELGHLFGIGLPRVQPAEHHCCRSSGNRSWRNFGLTTLVVAVTMVAMQDASSRVAWVREAAKVSAREFGRLVGISGTQIRNIETARKALGLSTAQHIAAVIGVSIDWLLSGAGRAPTARAVKRRFDAAREKSTPAASQES